MSQSMVLHQLLGGDFTYYGILKIGPSFAHEQSMTAIAKAMTKLRSLRRMVRRTGSLLALTGLFFALSLLHGEPLWSRENHIRHARQIRPYSRPYAHSSQRCAPTTVDCIADATATVTTEESTYADDEATVIHTGKSTLLWQTQKGAKQDHQNLQGSKPSNAIKDATNVWDSPSFENDSHSRVPDDPATPTDGQMDHIKGSVEETAKAISTQSTTKSQHTTDWCQGFPGAENVVVVIKTGATEVYARLAMQLLTISSCASNLLIFSDLEQDVGDFHIHDALGDIGHEYKDKCAEFELYNDLQRYHTQHESFSTLSTTKGWELDKWKNIPALHKAYQKYPDMDWYVFMDTDTYLGWSNLLKLLSRLNPNSPLYFGSIWWYGDFGFAQGGAGYVISNAGARKFEEVHDSRHITAWEDDISKNCCGDVALAMALADAGVNLTQAYPMMQCDPPSVLEWSERIWCTPAVSWHHVTPQDVDALWQFEKHWLEKSRRDEEVGPGPSLSNALNVIAMTMLTLCSEGESSALSLQRCLRALRKASFKYDSEQLG